METHVYLHKNGGFPQIFKNAYPTFTDEDLLISTKDEDEVIYEVNQKKVFRVDVLMEEDE